MKRHRTFPMLLLPLFIAACGAKPEPGAGATVQAATGGQAAVSEEGSQKSIATIAVESPDHTTLVAALKAVNWLDALANPGPLTVFAPVNAAFDKLPAGTVDNLLKPENQGQLRDVLLHHVITSVYEPKDLQDGATLSMLAGGPAHVSRQGDEITIDGAKVIASVRAGNGMVYVIDGVMVPKS